MKFLLQILSAVGAAFAVKFAMTGNAEGAAISTGLSVLWALEFLDRRKP